MRRNNAFSCFGKLTATKVLKSSVGLSVLRDNISQLDR